MGNRWRCEVKLTHAVFSRFSFEKATMKVFQKTARKINVVHEEMRISPSLPKKLHWHSTIKNSTSFKWTKLIKIIQIYFQAKLSLLEGVHDEFTLSCEGKILSNDFEVSCLSSVELDLTVPMLGGKVHGSLARAGKVKGQTPKVEKQEKKKKKTGRAKRRIQFNRRFANVVQGFGRRRGPNANSA